MLPTSQQANSSWFEECVSLIYPRLDVFCSSLNHLIGCPVIRHIRRRYCPVAVYAPFCRPDAALLLQRCST